MNPDHWAPNPDSAIRQINRIFPIATQKGTQRNTQIGTPSSSMGVGYGCNLVYTNPMSNTTIILSLIIKLLLSYKILIESIQEKLRFPPKANTYIPPPSHPQFFASHPQSALPSVHWQVYIILLSTLYSKYKLMILQPQMHPFI